MARKLDHDQLRGISAALDQAFEVDPAPVPDAEVHLGARAAEADWAALRAQLNDPPPQYQGKTQC